MSFKSQVAAINKRKKRDMLLTFRGTAIAMFARVVARTPVDSGRARGNWQTQLNSAPGSMLDVLDKSGRGAIARSVATSSQAQLGDSIFFINNLPYIKKLEDGSSDQAPAGMVKVTATEYQRLAKQNARKNRK